MCTILWNNSLSFFCYYNFLKRFQILAQKKSFHALVGTIGLHSNPGISFMSLAVKVIRIANEESKLGAKLGKSLNRLHTSMGRSKTNLSKWGLCWCSRYSLWMRDLRADHATPAEMPISWKRMQPGRSGWLLMRRLSTVQKAWPNIWPSAGMMDTKEEEEDA